jgi:hypothetical protein
VATVTAEPEYLKRLVDDAAIFPPGNVPLEQAVAEHLGHRTASYAELVGGFVVSDTRLADLAGLVSADDHLGINVVVTGGAGAIEPAVRWATRADGLELRALEIALRDEDDLARNAARVVAMLDHLRDDLGDDVQVYVEPPRAPLGHEHGWLAALDEIAMADLRLKFRTGGVTAEAFPSSVELAASIDAALDRETPFKCTAGLHNAVRHTGADGFEHHGFLNVLMATQLAFDGVGAADSADLLERRDGPTLAEESRALDLAGARRWFTSFGSCSVAEPWADLHDLGLIGG